MTNPSNSSKQGKSLPAALALSASIAAGAMPGGMAQAGEAGAQGKAPQSPVRAAEAAPVVLQAGPLSGRIVEADARTGVAGATVHVRDDKGKLVVQTRTDKDGRYDLGKLAAGGYILRCGRAAGRLLVEEKAEAKTLTLVLPSAIALASPIQPAQAAEPTETLLGIEASETVIMMIGVGLAVVATGIAVGVGIAVADDDDDDDAAPAVSPTTP